MAKQLVDLKPHIVAILQKTCDVKKTDAGFLAAITVVCENILLTAVASVPKLADPKNREGLREFLAGSLDFVHDSIMRRMLKHGDEIKRSYEEGHGRTPRV